MPTTNEWMYFASGALLPTLAYYWLIAPTEDKDHRRSRAAAAATTTKSGSSLAASSSTTGTNKKKTRKEVTTATTTSAQGQQEPSSKERRRENETNRNETSRNADDQEGEGDDGSDQEDGDDWSDESSDDNEDVPLACSEWGYAHAPYKMVLVVNQELNMGKGKIAAQCGHASVGCYKRAVQKCPKGLQAWEHTGCAKIAVKCPTTADLETIAALAKNIGVPSYLVEDAGRTQIAAGSRTVLGLFGPVAVFGPLTDHLKLM